MTEKRFVYIEHKGADYILDEPNYDLDFIEMLGDTLEAEEIVDLLNAFHEENEQLKQDRFICLDCEHSGYTEIGCLCEKEDCWTEYKTECEDYKELE